MSESQSLYVRGSYEAGELLERPWYNYCQDAAFRIKPTPLSGCGASARAPAWLVHVKRITLLSLRAESNMNATVCAFHHCFLMPSLKTHAVCSVPLYRAPHPNSALLRQEEVIGTVDLCGLYVNSHRDKISILTSELKYDFLELVEEALKMRAISAIGVYMPNGKNYQKSRNQHVKSNNMFNLPRSTLPYPPHHMSEGGNYLHSMDGTTWRQKPQKCLVSQAWLDGMLRWTAGLEKHPEPCGMDPARVEKMPGFPCTNAGGNCCQETTSTIKVVDQITAHRGQELEHIVRCHGGNQLGNVLGILHGGRWWGKRERREKIGSSRVRIIWLLIIFVSDSVTSRYNTATRATVACLSTAAAKLQLGLWHSETQERRVTKLILQYAYTLKMGNGLLGKRRPLFQALNIRILVSLKIVKHVSLKIVKHVSLKTVKHVSFPSRPVFYPFSGCGPRTTGALPHPSKLASRGQCVHRPAVNPVLP
ncbi:hypothetical protein C8R44DRAFT_851198 [Mycena epipterygia]|nr:hypothetical protein C8R44DRAFT_851198 [Mycena epipterygia]